MNIKKTTIKQKKKARQSFLFCCSHTPLNSQICIYELKGM